MRRAELGSLAASKYERSFYKNYIGGAAPYLLFSMNIKPQLSNGILRKTGLALVNCFKI